MVILDNRIENIDWYWIRFTKNTTTLVWRGIMVFYAESRFFHLYLDSEFVYGARNGCNQRKPPNFDKWTDKLSLKHKVLLKRDLNLANERCYHWLVLDLYTPSAIGGLNIISLWKTINSSFLKFKFRCKNIFTHPVKKKYPPPPTSNKIKVQSWGSW